MAIIKSKGSRSKVRRWGFAVKATKDGQDSNFIPPALTIGNYTAAISAAKDIQSELEKMPQFEGATIKVTPNGYETISQVVLNQLKEYEKLANLLTSALKSAAIEILALDETSSDFDQKVTETVGRWVIAERNKLKEVVSAENMPEEVVEAPEVNPYGIISDSSEIPLDLMELSHNHD